MSYFQSNGHFSVSSKIDELKYSDLLVSILNRYFGSGLGSRHALLTGENNLVGYMKWLFY